MYEFMPCAGIVVHTTSGTAALCTALYLGRRKHYGVGHIIKPHNIPLTVLGAGLLWFGWYLFPSALGNAALNLCRVRFGFNAGSALTASSLAANTAVDTHIAACTSCLTWLVLSWYRESHPSMVDVVNGAIAGGCNRETVLSNLA